MNTRIIDLTHTFTGQMSVYPGDSVPILQPCADFHTEGYVDHRVETCMHVGTHIDGPLHMVEGGKRLSDMPVGQFVGTGVLVDVRGKDKIDAAALGEIDIPQDSIVLFITGWSKKFGTDAYFEEHPYMTEECAYALIERGVKMIGLDTPSPDSAPFLVHKSLLGADILIIENLAHLDELFGVTAFEVYALPAKFETDSAPARVVARMF